MTIKEIETISFQWEISIVACTLKYFSFRDDTHMTSMKILIFKTPHLPCPATSKILPPPWPSPFNFKRTPPLQMITNQLSENRIQGWLILLGLSFRSAFRFYYQLINLVWLYIDFFWLSWSKSRPQSNFKNWKSLFRLFFYSVKIRWGKGWAEISLSTFFAALYSCVCKCPKISRNIFKKKFFF